MARNVFDVATRILMDYPENSHSELSECSECSEMLREISRLQATCNVGDIFDVANNMPCACPYWLTPLWWIVTGEW